MTGHIATGHIARALPIGLLLGLGLGAPAAATTIDGSDVLVGTTAGDTIRGHAGDDVLMGGRGPDRIWARIGTGGRGTDRVYVGSGNDRVTVVNTYGWLSPRVDCGPGNDTVVLPSGFDTIYPHCEHYVSAPSPYGRGLSARRGPG